MTDNLRLEQIKDLLASLELEMDDYFSAVENQVPDVGWGSFEYDYYWQMLDDETKGNADRVISHLLTFSGMFAPLVKSSSLTNDADSHDLTTETKRVRAAVKLTRYSHRGVDVIHDEGTVLGVSPSTQGVDGPLKPSDARRTCESAFSRINDILQLVIAAGEMLSPPEAATEASRYRPDTAFIMMWISKENPHLDDVCDAIKETFKKFGIKAVRADDIEHEDLITKKILDQIKTSEFLIADLTGARPSVYYEIGYAHALSKRVILYRSEGEGIHFDLAGYNCPEYSSLRELKEMLEKRLVEMTGRAGV
jgi:hypothetical protein